MMKVKEHEHYLQTQAYGEAKGLGMAWKKAEKPRYTIDDIRLYTWWDNCVDCSEIYPLHSSYPHTYTSPHSKNL